jgi:hypothetical protein
LNINATIVNVGFKRRRLMWITFAQQEALIVHKTYQDLLKDCFVRWTICRCYVKHVIMKKLNKKKMAIYSDEHDPNEVMWNKQNEKEEVNQIVINKEPSFVEVWHEGYIESKGERHYFWLIDPQGVDPRGNEYAPEVRWFFARVPKEVRVMYNSIIESFKQTQK